MPAPGHNTKVVGWQKRSKQKHKQVSKRLGIAKKHKESAKLVSGARTGKGKKKLARKQKLAEKEQAALAEATQDIEMQDTKNANKQAKKLKQGAQMTAVSKGDAMQE